jgi:sugar phosphate isomerase/epimerase
MNRRSFLQNSAVLPALISAPIASFETRHPSSTAHAQGKVLNRINGWKIKISLNAYSFNQRLKDGQDDLDSLIEFCADLGFDAIDPTGYYFPGYPEVPEDKLIHHIKRKAFVNGLAISGTGIRNDFTIPDPSRREKDIHLIKEWIHVASKLGAPVLRIFAGKTHPENYSREEMTEWIARDIRTCVEYGKQHGVVIAIQNHAHFLKTAEDIIKLFEVVNHPWFGLVLDIGSFNSTDPYEEIKQVAPMAVTWQIKENVKINNKAAKTDLKKLVQIFRHTGYRGYIPLETLGKGDPRVKVKRFLAGMNKALQK